MIDMLPDDKKHLPYCFYMDNLFTGYELLRHLQQRGYFATGTMRENRVPKQAKIESKKAMKKMRRGSYSSSVSDEGIIVAHWMDNSVVTLASQKFGVQPISTAERFCRKERKRIQVPQPNLVKEYNRYMGGVDRMDENISKYRIGIRGKKWWWSIFTWCLDAAVNNAWRLSTNFRQQSNLEFRRELVQSYLKTYGEQPKGGGRQRVGMREEGDSRVKNFVRYDNMGHFVVEAEKRRRCAGMQCKAVRTTMCAKCNVGLCIACFKPFHVQ